MKTCKKCGESLPLDDFYVHREMADGRLSFCKLCVKRRMRDHRADGDHVLMLQRKHGNNWSKERLKKYAPRIARNAQAMVSNHVKRGKLVRPTSCEECGSSSYGIEAAHHDYTRPLDVRWLCRRCHRRWDSAESKVQKLREAIPMAKKAAITITRGKQFPGERERVYRLRSGARGTGAVIYEHHARGSQQAYDAALAQCQFQAHCGGYEIVAYIDAF